MIGSPKTIRDRQISWIVRLLDRFPAWLEGVFGGQGRHSVLWLMAVALVLSIPLIVTPLPLLPQIILAVLFITLGTALVRLESRQRQRRISNSLHLLLVWLSVVVTLRYLYYRTFYTLNLDSWLNGCFSLLLYSAELYAILTLLLAYFQTLKLRDRQPIDLATVPRQRWPRVDVYIPTYNEDVEIVRKTALAAIAIDYPDELKAVYILDDGRKFPERRESLRQVCEELGCDLMTRDNNDHAKAGNINHAMLLTEGDLILILDCDHVPSRNILQETVGFFTNPKVSLVQTPHWFYNPDPFERNLLTEGQVPVGNELFYKILQKGNDFWNAAFFCGSAAVVRKSHLLEVGGIAVETVTEDCHTSFRLHVKGYETVYYDKIMVAGLAPEKFSSYVGQQVRWARGMAQILRLEWPMFNRRLSLPQRICYTSATTHFFFGFPRLMYAIAPVVFLLFGINSVRGLGLETLTYALPSILLSLNANYIIHKGVRFSFWNEIFEYAMAFQNGLVTFMALLNPRLGSFNVTDKGVKVTRRRFDWSSVRALILVGLLSLLSVGMVPYWILSGLEDTDAVLINATWCLVNVLLLGAALVVALEQPQLRQSHRLARQLRVELESGSDHFEGTTLDVSETGCRLLLSGWPNLVDRVQVTLHGDTVFKVRLQGQVARVTPHRDSDVVAAIEFVNLSQAQQDALALVIFSDVQEWYSQHRTIVDKPLASVQFLATSLFRAFREPQPAAATQIRKQVQAAVQVYTEGYFLQAMAIAINSRTIQMTMTLDQLLTFPSEKLKPGQPVGLIVAMGQQPVRLIAQIEQVDSRSDGMVLEVSFPQVFDGRQGDRIDALLRNL